MWAKSDAIQPGQRPGSLFEQQSRVRILWTRYDGQTLEQGELRDFSELPPVPERQCLWLDIVGVPGTKGLDALGASYGLHRLALEDVQHLGQKPKLESFDQHSFAVLQIPLVDDGDASFEQLSLFIRPHLVISVHEQGELFDPVRRRLEAGRGVIRTAGSDYLLYALMDLAVDLGFPLISGITEQLYELEERVEEAHADMSRDIYSVRRLLSALLRQAQRQKEVVRELLEGEQMDGIAEQHIYWRDCMDHADRYAEGLAFLRESAADLLNTHLALISHRMNDVMKVLTVMSTVFVPLSFLVGLYGMNFNTDSPYNLPELDWKYGYLFVWGVMICVVGGVLVFFRRKRWI